MTHIINYYWNIRGRIGRISSIGVMKRSIGIMIHDGVVSVVKNMGLEEVFWLILV